MHLELMPIIAVHATFALTSVLLGPIQALRRTKGDPTHKLIGRIWVIAMALTCLTSFAIMHDGLSWLHGLALFTLISIGLGVSNARRGRIRAHVFNMIGSYLGTLIAFVFAVLVPTRVIPELLAKDPFLVAGAFSAIAVVVTVGAAVIIRLKRPRAAASEEQVLVAS